MGTLLYPPNTMILQNRVPLFEDSFAPPPPRPPNFISHQKKLALKHLRSKCYAGAYIPAPIKQASLAGIYSPDSSLRWQEHRSAHARHRGSGTWSRGFQGLGNLLIHPCLCKNPMSCHEVYVSVKDWRTTAPKRLYVSGSLCLSPEAPQPPSGPRP